MTYNVRIVDDIGALRRAIVADALRLCGGGANAEPPRDPVGALDVIWAPAPLEIDRNGGAVTADPGVANRHEERSQGPR